MAKSMSKKVKKKIDSTVKAAQKRLDDLTPSKSRGPSAAAIAGVAVAGAAGVAAAVHFLKKDRDETSIFSVVPQDEDWAVTLAGRAEPLKVFDTKKDAVAYARETANDAAPAELSIHGSDGKFQTSHSYTTA